MEEANKFRTLFVVEPSHDLSITKKYTDNVKFITTGTELVEEFDPKLDAIIPMGRTSACLIAGLFIRSKIPKGEKVKIGIYRSDAYIFIDVEV